MSERAMNGQCEASTKTGERCRNRQVPGSYFCRRHSSKPQDEPAHAGHDLLGEGTAQAAMDDEHKDDKEEKSKEQWRKQMKVAMRQEAIDLAAEAAQWPRGRDISRDELARILEEHNLWHTSQGKQGKRGDLSYANLFWQKADGLWFYLGNLRGTRFMGSSLKGAFFHSVDLRGASLNNADLRDATITESDLRGAYLRETKLSGARLDDSDLTHAHMEDALLDGEDKSEEELQDELEETRSLLGSYDDDDDETGIERRRSGASLEGARLNHAVLVNAQLSEVTGLRSEQLGGADLTNAKLPADVAKFDLLGNVAEISKAASATFLAQVGASFYSLVTVATTDIYAIGKSSAVTKLPILGTDIPIATFFVAAPFVLCAVFLYFHMYLLRLWRLLGALPARFPDGRSLDEKAFPWLLVGLVEMYVPLLRERRRPLWWMEVAISIATGWLLVPAAIAVFLWAFVTAGDLLRATVVGLLLAGVVVFGAASFRIAGRTLRGESPTISKQSDT